MITRSLSIRSIIFKERVQTSAVSSTENLRSVLRQSLELVKVSILLILTERETPWLSVVEMVLSDCTLSFRLECFFSLRHYRVPS